MRWSSGWTCCSVPSTLGESGRSLHLTVVLLFSLLYEYCIPSISLKIQPRIWHTALNTTASHLQTAISPLRKSEKTVTSLPPSKLFLFPFAVSLTPIDKKTFPHFLGLRGYPSIIHNSNICAFFAPCQSLSFY